MSRARNIKPSFFKNEELAECSLGARLLFIGLWTLADREGRIEDRPKRIKAEVFPYENEDVETLLRELVGNGFVIRYEAEGVKCLYIPNFVKHQRPHPKETPSQLPELPGNYTASSEQEMSAPEDLTVDCAFPSPSLNDESPSSESPKLRCAPNPGDSEPKHGKQRRKPVEIEDLSIPGCLDTPNVRAAIGDWLKYKREKGQSYKQAKYLSDLLGGFSRDGPDGLIAAIRHSLGQNYDGIFRPKDASNGKPPRSPTRDGYDTAAAGDI